MRPSSSRKLQRVIALGGLALAVNLWPDCFQNTAAVARLSSVEQTALSILALTLALVSLATWWRSTRGRAVRGRTIVWMTFLLLLGIEMSSRWSYRMWAAETTRAAVEELTDRATPGRMIFSGHPYVHYTGVPNQGFNNRGFHGADWAREKPAGVFRIACIGGSTTARGYPADLEGWLNAQTDTVFEVLNVGLGGWTTAHSVANFVLNVVDYNPDLVVIHHAWNDVVSRHAVEGQFRSDYSHALKPFDPPPVPDRWLIGVSLVYRYLKLKLTGPPAWYQLLPATLADHPTSATKDFGNQTELTAYLRNVETLVNAARIKDMHVVLTTMPHALDTTKAFMAKQLHVQQCNNLVRNTYATDTTVRFVDLDEAMTGAFEEQFEDLGHLTPTGRKEKARLVGRAILEVLRPGENP